MTDLGFAKRARAFAELLDAPLAIIEKRRVGNLDRAELMNVIGDVRGKRAIIVDDEIDTAGTLIEIIRALEREGVDRDLRLRHARRPERPGDRPDPRVEPARGRPDRLGPAARAQAARQDHDAVGRAAHRRGDQAHPPRRVGRRAVLERGLADPGDAPLGGWRRGHARHARRRDRLRGTGRRRIRRARGVRTGRRPMSLQLHRPDGEGGLEPRHRPPTDWRDQLQLAALGRGLRGGRLPSLKNPEMNPTSRFDVGAVLARARASLTFADPRRRLRDRLLEPAARLTAQAATRRGRARPAPGRSRQGLERPSPILDAYAIPEPIRRLERPRDPTPATPGRRDERPRGRVSRRSPTTRSAPSSPRSAPRSSRPPSPTSRPTTSSTTPISNAGAS